MRREDEGGRSTESYGAVSRDVGGGRVVLSRPTSSTPLDNES